MFTINDVYYRLLLLFHSIISLYRFSYSSGYHGDYKQHSRHVKVQYELVVCFLLLYPAFCPFFCLGLLDAFVTLIFIRVQLLDNAVSVSSVWQSESALRVHITPFYGFPSHLGCTAQSSLCSMSVLNS